MDRDGHRKWIPFQQTRVAQVDQYTWPEKDHTTKLAQNGITRNIYDANGHISYTLPLHMYPEVLEVHPEVLASQQPHFMLRDREMRRYVVEQQHGVAPQRAQQYAVAPQQRDSRLEGFYLW